MLFVGDVRFSGRVAEAIGFIAFLLHSSDRAGSEKNTWSLMKKFVEDVAPWDNCF